jgi:hypothetical protein
MMTGIPFTRPFRIPSLWKEAEAVMQPDGGDMALSEARHAYFVDESIPYGIEKELLSEICVYCGLVECTRRQ